LINSASSNEAARNLQVRFGRAVISDERTSSGAQAVCRSRDKEVTHGDHEEGHEEGQESDPEEPLVSGLWKERAQALSFRF
jgi:phage gp45-like